MNLGSLCHKIIGPSNTRILNYKQKQLLITVGTLVKANFMHLNYRSINFNSVKWESWLRTSIYDECRKHSLSNASSPKRERILMHKVPAAEKARSISFNWGQWEGQTTGSCIQAANCAPSPAVNSYTATSAFITASILICQCRQQRSWCKNANPKPAGFADCPNLGFEFAKMSGFPRSPGFSKPGFQSLVVSIRWMPSLSKGPRFIVND